MIRFNASSFEIVKNAKLSSVERAQRLFGYLGVDDATSVKALKDLCAVKIIDKVVIVYNEYTFSLLEVSFSQSKGSDKFQLDAPNTYRFEAKDVHLEALAA